MNALIGVHYKPDLTSLIVARPAWIGSYLQNILRGLPKAELYDGGAGVGFCNSPNTNSAEHTALAWTYNLFAILAAIAD